MKKNCLLCRQKKGGFFRLRRKKKKKNQIKKICRKATKKQKSIVLKEQQKVERQIMTKFKTASKSVFMEKYLKGIFLCFLMNIFW